MSKPISKQELNQIESTLDKLFSKLDLDVEFTKHFLDRVNDARNGKQITPEELIAVYDSLYKKHGVKLSKQDDEIEELVKSISTDINIPLNIDYNFRTKKIELTAKTIMRKKNFQSSNPVLKVEADIMSFSDYLLTEKAVTFGGKMYPKFGQVVITAGGAGSGKGFVLSNLMAVEGKVINVDDVKAWVLKSTTLAQKIKNETGVDVKNMELKNPDDVSKLHDIISGMHIADNTEKNIFNSIATSASDRKPNLIFDVTLKDEGKLDKIARAVTALGYDKSNIHIVWVVNHFEKAKEQNAARARSVSDAIMVSTHKGAAMTMHDLIMSNGTNVQNYMDGDIWVVFNLAGTDSEVMKSAMGGSYVKEANYIKVKQKGKKPEIDKAVSSKIASYVPATGSWK